MNKTLDNISGAGLDPLKVRELLAMAWDSGFTACYAWQEKRRSVSMAEEVPAPANPFKARGDAIDYDEIALSSFSLLVSDTLTRKRLQEPAFDWLNEDPKELVRAARTSDDPATVAALCMFLHSRGYSLKDSE